MNNMDKNKSFVVMSIDREELDVYGLDSNVSDETMQEIARNMQEWFDAESYLHLSLHFGV